MMKLNFLLPITCAGLLACGEKEEDTAAEPENEPSEQSSEDPVDDCVSLSAEECSANEACATIGGIPMAESEDGVCYIPGESQIYGCISILLPEPQPGEKCLASLLFPEPQGNTLPTAWQCCCTKPFDLLTPLA